MRKQEVQVKKKHMKRSISRKTLIGIIFSALLLSGTAIFIGYQVYASAMDRHYTENTVNLAKTAAGLLDPESLAKCTGEVREIYRTLTPEEKADKDAAYLAKYSALEQDEDWQFMRSQLQTISRENSLKSIMVVNVERAEHTVVYVLDSDVSETYCAPGTLDDSMTDEELENFAQSHAVISNTEEFGWLSSGAAPIVSPDGNVDSMVIIDISMNDVMRDRHMFLVNFIILQLLISAFLAVIITWGTRKWIVSPINKMARAAEGYIEEQSQEEEGKTAPTEHFANLNIKTGDELENLSVVMGEMETSLGKYIENLTRVTAEKERIGAELNIATQIQADMLPRVFPPFPNRHEFDIYATMDPAKEVGGDFYDFFLIDEDHLGLVMADVSGKGVPAALFMVIAKTLIKDRALMGGSPAEVLQYVNEQLCEGNDAEMFVTVWFAILDVKTGKGMAANAGHEHPAVRHADSSFELVVYRHSPAVATIPGMRFREHEFELRHGDTLFVYTDGVTEATDVHNELFGTDRMLAGLNRKPDADMKELLANVREDIDAFVGEAPQFDDITMLGLHFN